MIFLLLKINRVKKELEHEYMCAKQYVYTQMCIATILVGKRNTKFSIKITFSWKLALQSFQQTMLNFLYQIMKICNIS